MPTGVAGLLTDSAFESTNGPRSARLAEAADGQSVITRRQTDLDPGSGANSEREESSAEEGADSDEDISEAGSTSEADSFDGDSEPWDNSSDEDFDPNTAGKPKPKGKPKGPAASQPASKQPSKGVNPNGVTKGRFAGTLQFDCLEAPEQCQNICWFQNCVNDPSTPIEYMKGNDKVSNFNRVQSGVTTQNGRPCMTGPFGQKFWDTYPFNLNTNAMLPDGWQADLDEQVLQTDEWPMASFENPVFDESADPIQRSLRCITASSNEGGGTMWANFRAGNGPYNLDTTSLGYKKHQGKWAQHRKVTGILKAGDWFYANANFESFDDRNTTHRKILKTLGWCKAPFAGCKNDGRQFHLTHLRHDDITSAGRMNADYDTTRHNTYRIDGEDNDIHQYHVVLEITGSNADQVAAKVFEYRKVAGKERSEENILATRSSSAMDDGDSFHIKGQLPRTLSVEKSGSGCGTFTFTYADPKKDGHRVFRFSSDDKGFPDHSRRQKGEPLAGHYCLPEILPVVDARGRPRTGKDKKAMRAGTKLHCSFPGW